MSKHKTTNLNIPAVHIDESPKPTLPFDGNAVTEKHFSFSFSSFDRNHKLFNLGDDKEQDKVMNGHWFIDLLDCFKDASKKTITELKNSNHDLHPIDWSKTNANAPSCSEQLEYWQFRIDKSSGRIIGFKIDSVFYVVWLDPHHNLTDSDHYEGAKSHKAGKSTFEIQELTIKDLKNKLEQAQKELNETNILLAKADEYSYELLEQLENSGEKKDMA